MRPSHSARSAHRTRFRLAFRFVLLTAGLAAANAFGATEILPDAPPISSRSFVLMDADTSQVIAERDGDLPLPPASLTKIMTSYVAAGEIAAGRIDLADDVPISVKAWRTGGSKMFVREGTTVKLEDLLRGIVIQSGNDASVAVAEYIGGDEDGFANMMNAQAKALGMTSTRFVNATGLPDDGHHSSAHDLSLLAAALVQRYPEHYRMYSERSFNYGDIDQPNRNRLLWRDKSVDGVKTGLTDAAGYCLVASALRDGTRLVASVMGAASNDGRFQDAQKLLAYGFRYFESREIYGADEVLATVDVWYGETEKLDVGTAEALRLTIPRGRYDDLDAVLDLPHRLDAPIDAGAELGTVRLSLDGETLAEAPLVATVAIAEGGAFSRLADSVQLFFRGIFGSSDDAAAE